MQALPSILLFAAICSVVCGIQHPDWHKVDISPDPEHIVKIGVALRQQNVDLLTETALSVSDPDSPSYGKYLSMDEITEIVSATPTTIKAVTNWLLDNKAISIDLVNNRDFIFAALPLSSLESMVNVKMHHFENIHDGRVITRSSQTYSIPSYLSEHIDLITGISSFPMESRRKSHKPSPPTHDSSSNAPSLISVLSRGGPNVAVKFTPICKNGQITKTTPPCSESPPTVSHTLISFTSASPAISEHFNYTEVPTCSNINNAIVCEITNLTVVYYHNYNVHVTQIYSDGSESETSSWKWPVVSTPPVVPQTISQMYRVPPNYVIENPKVTQAVVEFEQQYFSTSDLQLFFEEMGIPGANTPVTVIGPNNQTDAGGEANLDIQYIMAVAPGAPTTFWSIYANSSVEIDDILKWAVAMSNTTNPPLVNSISYGMSENNVDKYLGDGYLARSDIEFRKLAGRGITIIIADGDTGAGDLGALPMGNPTCTTLHPDWPSQSPWVTAIGTTYITPWAEPICYKSIDCDGLPLGEVSTSMDNGLFWTTGGGFSNTQSQPSYQSSFVSSYLSNPSLLPPSSVFNASGRGYPDAVAIGHNCMVCIEGEFIPVDGTSASAPIFAGIVSLLNDVRMKNGKGPLGFLNPLLYKIAQNTPQAFYDVTVGYNRCGAYDWIPTCCEFGYHAGVGWDAIGGLGTPNFEILAKEVLNY
uniref:Predicted protein n=1 Tax=Hordeum vulgare subsp. vulgare TaxID=112509 RepID=F2E6Q3_HORVV|nr:predicted protein [Hordeum vulgare subsp. vulgare]